MEYILALISGIVQGLTEFLPISSSGHLVILHEIFNFQLKNNLAFDVALHLGTLLALLMFFWSDAIRYLKAWFKSLAYWQLKEDSDQRLAWYLFLGTLPAVIAGYFLADLIGTVFRSTYLVIAMLIGVGLLFFLVEKLSKKELELSGINWLKALLIGLAQAIALIPGISRSGITIITGMSLKLKRDIAARFSFLLAIPVVLGAGSKEFFELIKQGIIQSEIGLYLIGFIVSAIVGYFCIKYFLLFLKKYPLYIFGVYRILLGLGLLIYFLLR